MAEFEPVECWIEIGDYVRIRRAGRNVEDKGIRAGSARKNIVADAAAELLGPLPPLTSSFPAKPSRRLLPALPVMTLPRLLPVPASPA